MRVCFQVSHQTDIIGKGRTNDIVQVRIILCWIEKFTAQAFRLSVNGVAAAINDGFTCTARFSPLQPTPWFCASPYSKQAHLRSQYLTPIKDRKEEVFTWRMYPYPKTYQKSKRKSLLIWQSGRLYVLRQPSLWDYRFSFCSKTAREQAWRHLQWLSLCFPASSWQCMKNTGSPLKSW